MDFLIKPIERHVLAAQLLNTLWRSQTFKICVYSQEADYVERLKQILLLQGNHVTGAIFEKEVLDIAANPRTPFDMFVLDIDLSRADQ